MINDLLDYTNIEHGLFNLTQKPFNLVRYSSPACLSFKDYNFSHIVLVPLSLTYPHASQLDVLEVVREVARSNIRKGVEFRFLNFLPTSYLLLGDPERLQQCLIHFVSNAIKFTKEGRVTLEVRDDTKISSKTVSNLRKSSRTSLSRELSPDLYCVVDLQFTVVDTGIGMDKVTRRKLFTPFLQVLSI